MSDRKSLSKAVRFEVFKRDGFKCQYCGAEAPNVLLHADHIHPVAEGGTNDVINLVTACEGCNLGKGARLLSDDTAIKKQRAEIERLEERREQLEMMVEWRNAATGVEVSEADYFAVEFRAATGFNIAGPGLLSVRRWLQQQFSINELVDAMRTGASQYMKQGTQAEAERVLSTTITIAKAQREPDADLRRQAAYAFGILRNCLGPDTPRRTIEDFRFLLTIGMTFEHAKILAKTCSDLMAFDDYVLDYTERFNARDPRQAQG